MIHDFSRIGTTEKPVQLTHGPGVVAPPRFARTLYTNGFVPPFSRAWQFRHIRAGSGRFWHFSCRRRRTSMAHSGTFRPARMADSGTFAPELPSDFTSRRATSSSLAKEPPPPLSGAPSSTPRSCAIVRTIAHDIPVPTRKTHGEFPDSRNSFCAPERLGRVTVSAAQGAVSPFCPKRSSVPLSRRSVVPPSSQVEFVPIRAIRGEIGFWRHAPPKPSRGAQATPAESWHRPMDGRVSAASRRCRGGRCDARSPHRRRPLDRDPQRTPGGSRACSACRR